VQRVCASQVSYLVQCTNIHIEYNITKKMGDSDDEHDRRRRDKFRGERNDYDNRRPPPRGYGDQQRGRGDRNSHSWDRGTKREYYGGNGRDQSANRDRRDSYGGGGGGGGRNSPPFKKSKREWENNDQPWKAPNTPMPGEKAAPSVPMLMSFKDFILQQEDSIDEVESVRRYHEYKVEFKRTQINDFFVLHKDEEWFEEKYHPIKSIERRDFVRHGIKKRLRLFLDFLEQGLLDAFKLSITNSVEVLKLLDKTVIKLDGGTEEDLKALDLPPPKPEPLEEGEELKTEDETNGGDVASAKLQDSKKSYDYDGTEEGEEDAADDPLPPGVEPDDEEAPGDDDAKDTVVINDDDDDAKEGEVEKKEEYVYDGSQVKRPYSLYMRGVAAVITRADLEAVCKRYPGFLRIAMSDPSADKQFARRAWASFDHTVNIKDICWNLSNIRVKELELNPVVNRDVSNRVRPVNGLTCSPITMQLDMNFVIKLVKKLDEKHELFMKSKNGNGEAKESTEEAEVAPETEDDDTPAAQRRKEEEAMNLPQKNPVIEKFPENIETLVEGIDVENEEDDKKDYPIIVNEKLEQWLDLLVLYLRIVHCVDYYNATDYVHEDEMPMRCGIMHVRAAPLEAASKKDALEWHNQNSSKLEHFLKEEEVATDERAEKLGKKKEEDEFENFIKANTQELAKDKWLCPLSGKKFRGPEFIRKHIVMKHAEHVENVKSEVKYFNNYIYDLKRPCFPDARARVAAPGANAAAVQEVRPPMGALTGANTTPITGMRPSTLPTSGTSDRSRITPGQQVFPSPKPQYPTTPQGQGPIETYGRINTFPPKAMQRGGSGQRGDYRKLIKYRDLDAPEESDFF